MPVASWFYLHWYGPDAFNAQDGGEGGAPEMNVSASYDVRVVADQASAITTTYISNGTRIGAQDIAAAQDAVFLNTKSDVRTISDPSNFSPGELADGLGNVVVEPGITVAEALRVLLAANAGKVRDAETGTIKFRDINDTKDRIVATTDANGNRNAVTLDVS